VEGGKGKLCKLKGWVVEDGFVCKDLGLRLDVHLQFKDSSARLTIPMVASVLMTIQIMEDFVVLGAAGVVEVDLFSPSRSSPSLSTSSDTSSSSGVFAL
jgi:hypothetical protein